MDGMAWIPGATFLMGSDRHYPEEAPELLPALPARRADGSACRHLHLAPGLPLRRADTTTSASRRASVIVRLAARRLRAIISPAMHGARRPVKGDRGVQPAVIPTY
jgi:hypothetical protein